MQTLRRHPNGLHPGGIGFAYNTGCPAELCAEVAAMPATPTALLVETRLPSTVPRGGLPMPMRLQGKPATNICSAAKHHMLLNRHVTLQHLLLEVPYLVKLIRGS